MQIDDTVQIQFVEPFDFNLIQRTIPVCLGDRIEIEGVYNPIYEAVWDFFGAKAKNMNILSQNRNIKTEVFR